MKTKQVERPRPTVYKSKKYSFGFIHIVRARTAYGKRVISVVIRSEGANGVTKTKQSLTLPPQRWREILPLLAEELGGAETDSYKDSRKEAQHGQEHS